MLKGYKTYIGIIGTVAVAIARLFGVEIPPEVLALTGGFAAYGIRDAQKKR